MSKTFDFIFYSCTLIVMPLMVFALIRLKKRVLKIEQDRKRRERVERERERENMAIMCYLSTAMIRIIQLLQNPW